MRQFSQRENQLHHRSNTNRNDTQHPPANRTGSSKSPTTDANDSIRSSRIDDNGQEREKENHNLSVLRNRLNKRSFNNFHHSNRVFYDRNQGLRIRSMVLWLMVLIYTVSCLIVYMSSISNKQRSGLDASVRDWWASRNLTSSKRFMLVVAHPDDECLFFSPTILNLLTPRLINVKYQRSENFSNSSNRTNESSLRDDDTEVLIEDKLKDEEGEEMEDEVEERNEIDPLTLIERIDNSTALFQPWGHILSLSSGNADGLGIIRAREMRASCWALGITSSKCITVDHPELQDSMKVWWPEKKIMEFVYVYIDLWKIDTIITFDENGVSGHANHRAISAAISRAVHTDPKFPTTYVLRSASLLSKYASLFSLPYSILNHHRTRKLLFSTFDRPPFHPSLDSKKISRNVIKILSDLNLTSPLRSKDRSSNSKKLSNYPPYKFDLLQKNKNHHKNIYNSKKKSKMIEKSYVAYEEGEDDDELRDLDNEDNEEFRKVKTLEKIRRMRMSERKTHQSFFLSDLEQYYRTRRAFNQHRSQKVWFRRLWLIFSRYMWINELHRVVPIEYRFNDDGVIDDDDDDYDDYEGDFSRSITNDDDDQNR